LQAPDLNLLTPSLASFAFGGPVAQPLIFRQLGGASASQLRQKIALDQMDNAYSNFCAG
jgi:hypothetical protein